MCWVFVATCSLFLFVVNGEHIWCLIRVHVNSTCYLLFFRSEKTLQRVVATIMTIFNNNNTMNGLPFLMILSYRPVSPTMNLPPIPDSLRLQGWLVESHTDDEGPVSVGISQTQGMYSRGNICSCWHVGFILPVLGRTTFMPLGSEVTGLTLLTHGN